MKKTTFLFAAAALLATVAIGGNPRLYWYGGANASVPKNYQTWNMSTDSLFWFDPSVQIPDFPVNLYSNYTAGATAIFDETAAAGSDTVRIDGPISVDSLLFNNTRTYVLRSKTSYMADSLIGTGALIKDGVGTLTIDLKNKLTGGTILKGGRIYLEKADSANVFGDKLRIENGTVSVNTLNNSSPSRYARIRVPIEIPTGATAKIELGRYSYFYGNVYGDGDLELSTAGDRTFVCAKKDAGTAMNFKGFNGNLIVSKCASSGVTPGYYALYFSTNKSFRTSSMSFSNLADSVLAKNTVDSTFWNKKLTLKAGAGLTSISGTRCYGIGELNAENDESFLGGYGAGSSTSPIIYWMFGMSNTDVVFPGTIKDVSGASKNLVGLIKTGSGKYTFTSTKSNGNTSLGVLVDQGSFFINIPVTTPATTTALGRAKTSGVIMKIRTGAIAGGNGRLTGAVLVDSLATLQVGYDGIGQIDLADTLSGTIASPLKVHHNGKVIMKVASKTNHDLITGNNTVTFNGGTLLVKGTSDVSLSVGDTVRLLTYKKAGTTKDSISLQTEGLPTGKRYSLKGDTIITVTSTIIKDANNVPLVSKLTGGDSIKVTTTYEYRISLIVGAISGVNNVVSNSVSVYPSLTSGLINIDSKDADITKVEIFNINGQQVMNQAIGARSAVLHLDKLASGLYYTKVTIGNKVETHKVLLK